MIKLKKKVVKKLIGKEVSGAAIGNVAGGHDFQPTAFRGCHSNDTVAQLPN
ncbi:hypothetical protein [Pseudoalteromonas rubra]|uniref:hypothetical protein n=1 Tax=Pseudoalteromonas rubra TaxID=43658 RepID=UPI000ADBE041|nr:hypothetical protein [Pseudoalteromonas rubra]